MVSTPAESRRHGPARTETTLRQVACQYARPPAPQRVGTAEVAVITLPDGRDGPPLTVLDQNRGHSHRRDCSHSPGTRRDGPADSQAGQPGGRGEATSYRPRPAGQGDVMPLRPEPRTSRSDARLHPAGERARDPLAVRDDAAGRVTARPNARARHHSARRARGPKRATYDKPRGLSGDLTQAGSEKARHPARAVPPQPAVPTATLHGA